MIVADATALLRLHDLKGLGREDLRQLDIGCHPFHMQTGFGGKPSLRTEALIVFRTAVAGDDRNVLVEPVLHIMEQLDQAVRDLVAGACRNDEEAVKLVTSDGWIRI